MAKRQSMGVVLAQLIQKGRWGSSYACYMFVFYDEMLKSVAYHTNKLHLISLNLFLLLNANCYVFV